MKKDIAIHSIFMAFGIIMLIVHLFIQPINILFLISTIIIGIVSLIFIGKEIIKIVKNKNTEIKKKALQSILYDGLSLFAIFLIMLYFNFHELIL